MINKKITVITKIKSSKGNHLTNTNLSRVTSPSKSNLKRAISPSKFTINTSTKNINKINSPKANS